MESNYSIISAQNVKMSLPLASLGDRIFAYLIDNLIFLGYIMIVIFVGIDTIWAILIAMIPFILYHPLCEYFNEGRSIGKMLMKIQVATLDGSPLGLDKILIRWVFRLVDFTLFSGVVALVAAAISDKNQRVGDIVAQTTVISQKERTSVDRIQLPDWEGHELIYPNVQILSQKQIQLIRESLHAYNIENRMEILEELSQKVAKKLNVESPEQPYAFLKTVVQDYAYLSENPSYEIK